MVRVDLVNLRENNCFVNYLVRQKWVVKCQHGDRNLAKSQMAQNPPVTQAERRRNLITCYPRGESAGGCIKWYANVGKQELMLLGSHSPAGSLRGNNLMPREGRTIWLCHAKQY